MTLLAYVVVLGVLVAWLVTRVTVRYVRHRQVRQHLRDVCAQLTQARLDAASERMWAMRISGAAKRSA
jgi:uncharacterized membrane-anchored protein YhcB (DUF1043 family)